MSKEHTYTNGEVTIIWRKERCIHSARCWKGLPAVFQPGQRPWIKAEGQATEAIIAQVEQCPSGALSYRMNGEGGAVERSHEAPVRMEVTPGGPLVLHGDVDVVHPDGSTETRTGRSAFCRCGASANKPWCDGSHRRVGALG